jgi:hypothetical protein
MTHLIQSQQDLELILKINITRDKPDMASVRLLAEKNSMVK